MSSVLPNRETWLNVLLNNLRPVFKERGFPIPDKVRVSCGFPSERAFGKRRVIGQCWYPINSADESTEIFVSPVQAEALDVAETLTHEGCHAAIGAGHGHKGKFITVARAMGFTKPWTSTPSTPELTKLLKTLVPGDYPHAEMKDKAPEGGIKTKKTYLLKATCPTCDYTIRVTQKWVETGMPLCKNNHEPVDFSLSGPEIGGEEDEPIGEAA